MAAFAYDVSVLPEEEREFRMEGEKADVRIPLVAKKVLFAVIPKKSDPIRGHIWVQGYLTDGDIA